MIFSIHFLNPKKSAIIATFSIFSILCLSPESYAQSQTGKIKLSDYLKNDSLTIQAKEYVVRLIQQANSVKPIDKHEFVHFFLDRYEAMYKQKIKDEFSGDDELSKVEIKDRIEKVIAEIALEFVPQARAAHSDANIVEFDLLNLGKNNGKGPTNKGPGQPCNNADFETGNATGWDLTEGDVNANPYEYINVVPTGLGAQHVIQTGGNDPIVPALPRVFPGGGGTSLQLGDGTGTGGRAAGISQTFLVDSNSAAFTYSYALVLEDPSGHSIGEKPFFKVNMYDQNNNPIACGDYQVIAGPPSSGGDPDFVAYNGGFYLPWRTTFAPLVNYIGQNVTIEIIIGDCSQSGHYGYGYFDASCDPLEIIPSETVICGGNPVTLTAPPGAASYLWTPGGQTTQSITTNQPGHYEVTITPVTGSQCSITLEADIFGSPDFPVASFNPNPTTVCVGDPIIFTNNSYVIGTSSIDSVHWDFQTDGVIDDTAYNASYNYMTPGNYTVTLTVWNNGCSDDTTFNVTVDALPTANFSSTNECFGTSNSFTDLSNPNGGTITNWNWDFDNNGTVDNTAQNPTHGYPSAGSYTVELLVESSMGCKDSITKQVIVNPIPTANFSVDTVCFGQLNTFTDLSSISSGNVQSWQWDFGDGLGVSNGQNPTYLYGSAGVYPVTLTVTSDSGCINTIIDSAWVNDLPTAEFITNNVCLNSLANFTDLSNPNGGVITSWNWDFENDGIVDDNNQNTTNAYLNPGVYNVKLIVSSGAGCSDTAIQQIEIYPEPTASFSANDECFGVPITFTDNSTVGAGILTAWQWNFGNSNTSNVQHPTHNYSNDGTFTVQLIVTTDNGCSDTVSHPINVYPLPVANFSPTEVCLNTSTQFLDLSTISNANTFNTLTTWQWDFGDGTGTSALQNPTYTYNQEGVYPVMLTVTSNNGCSKDTTINVTVNPLPLVDFEGPAQGCSPVCANFQNNSSITSGIISNWQWDFGDGNNSVVMSPSHCYENSSHSVVSNFDVTLTAISDKGCSTTLTQNSLISVFPIPLADFTYSPEEVDVNDPQIEFNDESIIASSWQWDLGDGNTSSLSNPIHTYPDSGYYFVTLYIENEYGCRDTISKTVRIKPTFAIWIPNAFTPDGDGTNDFFYVDGYGIDELETLIFDRWGVQVFEGHQVGSKWDGTYKGTVSVSDVYVYKVKARDVFGEWHDFVGRVTLLK